MNRAKIREILLAHGFTIKDGLDDLKPYVYEAVEAVLEAKKKEEETAVRQSSWWREVHVERVNNVDTSTGD